MVNINCLYELSVLLSCLRTTKTINKENSDQEAKTIKKKSDGSRSNQQLSPVYHSLHFHQHKNSHC